LRQLVVLDLRGRYAGARLGLLWSLLHPIGLIAILTVVFAGIMQQRLPGSNDTAAYTVYLCAGLLPWIGLQEIISRCTTVFVDQRTLIRHVAFPHLLLHVSLVLSAAINVAIMIAVFAAVLWGLGSPPSWTFTLWPLLVALQMLFAAGLGLITSVLNVFVRDLTQAVALGLQLWFWSTPIVYPASILPAALAPLAHCNPLYAFTRAHQTLLLDGHLPSLPHALALGAIAGGTLAAGLWLLHRLHHRVVDEL
jgi:lipopolysaccharide transport system permease protein